MTQAHERHPRLQDLLDDPLVRLVMQRDEVRREDVVALFGTLRDNLRQPGPDKGRDRP